MNEHIKLWLGVLVILVVGITVMNYVSAEQQTLGTFKPNTNIDLVQSGSNGTASFTSCNITSVYYPDSTVVLSNVQMTQRAADFNYTLTRSQTLQIGRYVVNGFCSDGTNNLEYWGYDFYVNPIGSNSALGFFIIIFVLAYGITFVGAYFENIPLVILGGLALLGIGIFSVNNGIDIYRNFATESLAIITIGVGSYFVGSAGIKFIQDAM